MAGLPQQLACIPGIDHAIYADDITVWTKTRSLGEQETALQAAVDAVDLYTNKIGLSTAPEKTEFVVIHGGRRSQSKSTEKETIQLQLRQTSVQWKAVIRILEMFLDEACTSNTWHTRTMRTMKQVMQIFHRITNRARGVKERELLHFIQAFLHSRILYGAPYHSLTKTQLLTLERLNNEARTIATGLPRYTPIDALNSYSMINTVADLIKVQVHTQVARLQSTSAGRDTLAKLGHDVSVLPPLPQQSPPWECISLTCKTVTTEHGK